MTVGGRSEVPPTQNTFHTKLQESDQLNPVKGQDSIDSRTSSMSKDIPDKNQVSPQKIEEPS